MTTTKDFCGLWACPSRCRAAHKTGNAHIHVAAPKRGVYRAVWNITPAGFKHPRAQGSKWSLTSLVLIPPSLWWPPQPAGTLLCPPWGPTLLFWKAALACAALWGYPIPGAGLCHFAQPVGVPLKISPVLQPTNLPPSLMSSPGVWLPLPSSNTSFQAFQKKKKKKSHLCFFLSLSEVRMIPYKGIVTKWNKKVRMRDGDRLLWDSIDEAQKRNWRGKLSVFLCFKHTQTMQDSYLPLRYINFYWFYLLETKYNVQYHSTNARDLLAI